MEDFARLAADVCSAPSALLSVVHSDRVQHVAAAGIKPDDTSANSLISRAILEPRLSVVSGGDVKSNGNGSHHRSGVQFYAGAPVATPEGCAIGHALGHRSQTTKAERGSSKSADIVGSGRYGKARAKEKER